MLNQSHLLHGERHSCDDLIAIFNRLFASRLNTILEKGGDEPLYSPAGAQCDRHRVVFKHDYFASALHEIAHWCIAGTKRRTQIDYGYWYAPDGRTTQQQRKFERVEVKPQALEWIFARAAGYKFTVSNDNLAAGETSNHPFELALYQQALHYCKQGLPHRAELFRLALAEYYGANATLDGSQFGPVQCG
ncbi:MAG: elongation factor P hydroxylase [Pseudomonadales bacterium]